MNRNKNKPIYKLFFSNDKIIDDTISILFFHIQNFHVPSNEKVLK